MIASPGPARVLPKIPAKNIPNVLIHEIINGQPLYRMGYREVMSQAKKIEDIMGSSSLQAFLLTYLTIWIGRQIDDTKYTILTNEAGLHIDKNNNLAGDILIFGNDVLTIQKINNRYASVPPKIAIEVDTDIALEELNKHSYMTLKTRKLLEFGAEKVIWFMTESRNVMIATPHGNWEIQDWDKDVAIMDGIVCNVGQYLKEKGSEFA